MFTFTTEQSKRLAQLRFENDWLFQKRKQPWKDFHKLLLENGFPKEMTVSHVRKKYSYMYETYKRAKQSKCKSIYFKIFDKFYGKNQVVDKFESWSDEWRKKLIICIMEAKELKMNDKNFWLTIERAMRLQDLPEDCCIQDIKGLWHHLQITFNRKHRMKVRHGETDWPLYDIMMEYFERFDPDGMDRVLNPSLAERPRKCSRNYRVKYDMDHDEYEFQWTKDITETFIQLRLQHDWLFQERKWAWNDLAVIMKKEYGFPKELTGREICRKWASTFSEYQKAIATNNKSWMYYPLFEVYLGEGALSFNPLKGWEEEWVCNFISARLDLNDLFKLTFKEQAQAWREVEKRLRSIGLPLSHSLLELPEMWTHLLKTYRWKKKFADKGILTEQWPYYEAMSQYRPAQPTFQNRITVKKPASSTNVVSKQEIEYYDDDNRDDDYEDDIKLFDLKQKMEREVKPKFEYLEANQCRSCSSEEGCVNIYDQKDDEGLNLAEKLRIIGDVKVEPTDNLPSQICLKCLQDLENAYKFRRKIQQVDKELRNPDKKVKVEILGDELSDAKDPKYEPDGDRTDMDEIDNHYTDDDYQPEKEIKVKKVKVKREPLKFPKKKKKIRKEKYEYYKICDQCGKYTKNLKNHLDTHATGKFYSCEVCDKKFKFKSGLVIHKAVHNATPKKTCEICGKTFHILAQYRRHFVYHANERKFECETCGKRFNTLDILRVHMRTHTDERPFPCPVCGKTFRTAGCVSRHKRIVHTTKKNQSQ